MSIQREMFYKGEFLNICLMTGFFAPLILTNI